MATPQSEPTANVADLYQVKGKAEIVDGRMVRMPPTGALPGYAAGEIFFSLKHYEKANKNGTAIGDNVGFIVNLANRRSFSPDAAFWAGRAPSMRFYEGAPLFAVEVRSDSDYGPAAERAIVRKRQDYFAAGTQALWEVDLMGDIVIQLWHAGNVEAPKCFKRGSMAHAMPVLPGWQMSVNELFPD